MGSRKNDKIMYLYWSKMWRICPKFGSNKSSAKVKDVDGLMDCCEPYPHMWQVWDKEAKEFKKVAAMRVINGAALSPISKGNGSVAEVALERSAKKKRKREAKQQKKE